jgi:putative PIN family toxin of toxin-antitoxin system
MSSFFVFDTNSLVSAALTPQSTNRKAFDKALLLGELVASNKTMEELIEVLFRGKFDKYFLNDNERWVIINKIEINTKVFVPLITISDCRDPKDNKFLELAISANASCVISGDKDLLALHPFREIPILNAVDFINNF